MFDFKNVAAAIGLSVIAAGSASAATFNFTAIADGAGFDSTTTSGLTGGEADWATIVGAGAGILDASGISVVGSGSATTASGTSAVSAYFDSGSAGLGVCSALTAGNQCNPSNDDNIGAVGGSSQIAGSTYETLTLTFNQTVNLSEIVFAGEGHGQFHGTVKINGVAYDIDALGTHVSGHSLFATALTGSVFNFEYVPLSTSTNNELYIGGVTVAAIPLPAAGLLLLGALGGLAALRRRRQTS